MCKWNISYCQMVQLVPMLFALAALFALPVTEGKQGGFRGGEAPTTEGIVAATEIKANLKESLEAVLGFGSNEERMRVVEAAMFRTFQALPKSTQGRLAPKAVRHLIQRFFSKVHGWTIQGLDGSSTVSSDLGQAAGISQSDVPALMEAALEARQHGRGLSMSEVVALAVALERLILEDSVKLLQDAYVINGLSTTQVLDKETMVEVLVSFVGHYILAGTMNATDIVEHQAWKQSIRSQPIFASILELAEDGVQNFKFAQKDAVFAASSYTFESASEITKSISHKFGRWQDEQCLLMRSALEKLDVNGTGRVPLQDFWAMDKVASFTFSEKEDTLRSTGSLDESLPGKPALRIANYIVAPGNCGTYASYYSVCCQNSCDPIMEALEGKLQAPSAVPERLIELIGNISSNGDELEGPASPLFGRNGQYLRARLSAIAERSGGMVHLDSRLFAQWMHFAFPRECPHPMEALAAPQQPRTVKQQMELVKAVAPEQWDVQDGFVPQWGQEDSVPLMEEIQEVSPAKSSASYFAMVAQFAALMALFGMALRTGLDGMRASAAACGLTNEKSKERAVPMTVKLD